MEIHLQRVSCLLMPVLASIVKPALLRYSLVDSHYQFSDAVMQAPEALGGFCHFKQHALLREMATLCGLAVKYAL